MVWQTSPLVCVKEDYLSHFFPFLFQLFTEKCCWHECGKCVNGSQKEEKPVSSEANTGLDETVWREHQEQKGVQI